MILIVDDSEMLRKTFRDIIAISFPDEEIREAGDGDAAMAVLDKQVPTLVFMDIKLPGKNGLELTREIKSKYNDVIVAIFTNHDLPEYRKTAKKCGAEYFFSKYKAKAEDILNLVTEVISRSPSISNTPSNGGKKKS